MEQHIVSGARACRRRMGAAVTLAVFSALPLIVFQTTLDDAATRFRIEFNYLLSGWGPWILVGTGVLCFIPVVVSIERSAYSRWALTPTIRRAYEIWGATLYLLGVLLLTQTAQISSAF